MHRTFETRLELRSDNGPTLSAVLDAYAALMSRAERLLLAKLQAGRAWTGDLKVSYYQHLGLSATHLDMAYRQLQAKLSSVAELAAARVKDLADKIASKRTDIARRKKALAKVVAERSKLPAELASVEDRLARRRVSLAATAKDSMREKHLFVLKQLLDQRHALKSAKDSIRGRIHALKEALHQHNRRLGNLEARRDAAKRQMDNPTLCFGSRKLFRSQFFLRENGYADLAEWRKVWKDSRSAQMTLDGNSSKESGNQFARLKPSATGKFDLELRLPRALKGFATRSFKVSGQEIFCIDFHGLSFNHGDAVIERVLASGRPVTVKFLRDETSWKVMVSVDDVVTAAKADYGRGALGVDMNAGHISATLVDADGNPIESFNFPCVTYGKSSDQAKDTIRKAAAEIAALAARLGVPVVSEALDFSKKKKALRTEDGPAYARMLSSFSYNAFDNALASACLRGGVAHVRVNPAYTSIIGRVKFARRYGLSVHEAASVSIARRAMGCSERLPRSSDGTVKVPTNGSVHVTLDLPVRKDASEETPKSRHLWTEWNGLNKEYHKKAFAARGSSGRRPSRPRWRVKPPAGRSGKLLHGPSTAAGRSRQMSLQSRGPGLAARQEDFPEIKVVAD